MKLTLTLTERTTRKEHWALEHNGELTQATITRKPREHSIDTQRRAIKHAYGYKANEVRFLGNRWRVTRWISEWMVL